MRKKPVEIATNSRDCRANAEERTRARPSDNKIAHKMRITLLAIPLVEEQNR